MRFLFCALAATTTVALLAIHGAAYSGLVLYDSAPWIGLIVLPGIFIPWLAFIVRLRKTLGVRATPSRATDATSAADSREAKTWTGSLGWLMRAVRLFPIWARCVIAATYVYFLVLLSSMAHVQGQAMAQDGRFILQDGSRFVRALTASEYQSMHAHDAMVMSGCALIFSVVPLLFFLVGRPEGTTQPTAPLARREA